VQNIAKLFDGFISTQRMPAGFVELNEQFKLCMDWRPYLDDGDRRFITSLAGERRLDRHQAAELWGIVLKIRTIARGLGRTR
jgi:hypothetical protein